MRFVHICIVNQQTYTAITPVPCVAVVEEKGQRNISTRTSLFDSSVLSSPNEEFKVIDLSVYLGMQGGPGKASLPEGRTRKGMDP